MSQHWILMTLKYTLKIRVTVFSLNEQSLTNSDSLNKLKTLRSHSHNSCEKENKFLSVEELLHIEEVQGL